MKRTTRAWHGWTTNATRQLTAANSVHFFVMFPPTLGTAPLSERIINQSGSPAWSHVNGTKLRLTGSCYVQTITMIAPDLGTSAMFARHIHQAPPGHRLALSAPIARYRKLVLDPLRLPYCRLSTLRVDPHMPTTRT